MTDLLPIKVELKSVKICSVECRNPECKKTIKAGDKFWAYHVCFGPSNDPDFNDQGCVCPGCAETIDGVIGLYINVLAETIHNRKLTDKQKEVLCRLQM